MEMARSYLAVVLVVVHSIRSLEIRWPRWSRPIPLT